MFWRAPSAMKCAKSLGQPVIVENCAGAGGNTGADAVAKAASDGYTLLMVVGRHPDRQSIPLCQMPFDVETAFIPVSNVADMSMLVVVNPKVEAKTLKEFVALAKANPGKINFGSPGIGTTGHLGLAMLMRRSRHEDRARALSRRRAGGHRSHRRTDRRRGRQSADRACAYQSGKLRPLAVAAKQRIALLPDVPTAAEQGVANYEASSWFGIAAPAGTPQRSSPASAPVDRGSGAYTRHAGAVQQIRRAADRRQSAGFRRPHPCRARHLG